MAVMCIPRVANDVVGRFDRLVEYRTLSANLQYGRARRTPVRTTVLSKLIRQVGSQKPKAQRHIIPSMTLARSSSNAPQPPSPSTSSPPPTLSPLSLAFRATRHTPPTSPPLEREIFRPAKSATTYDSYLTDAQWLRGGRMRSSLQ